LRDGSRVFTTLLLSTLRLLSHSDLRKENVAPQTSTSDLLFWSVWSQLPMTLSVFRFLGKTKNTSTSTSCCHTGCSRSRLPISDSMKYNRMIFVSCVMHGVISTLQIIWAGFVIPLSKKKDDFVTLIVLNQFVCI